MKLRARCLVCLAAAATMLAVVTAARAETCTLELKRLDSQNVFTPFDYIYRATMAQSFFVQMAPQGANNGPYENQAQTAAFRRIVHKEPKYESAHPFRGVAKLGSQEFAFALDAVSSTPAKAEKPDGKKATGEQQKPNCDSAVANLADQLVKATGAAEKPAEKPALSAISYNRLYFDFNHNGDLTDDKVVKAEGDVGSRVMSVGGQSYCQFQFPRVDVTIDVEGTKLDYSFFLRGNSVASPGLTYASISLNAAAYREGEITLEGKKRHVVLIDNNSNGRFDDETKIRGDVRYANGQVYAEQGDMLLVDPERGNPGIESPYDITSGNSRNFVSKLVNIDGRYYDVKITPAGDQLTLTPSPVALGNVTNPNDGYRAVIYSDKGFLKISGNKGTSTPVPEGEWKLLSYTINWVDRPEPSKDAAKKAEKEAAKSEASKKGSMLQALASLLGSTTRARPPLRLYDRRGPGDQPPTRRSRSARERPSSCPSARRTSRW